jgi:hypothetical protein
MKTLTQLAADAKAFFTRRKSRANPELDPKVDPEIDQDEVDHEHGLQPAEASGISDVDPEPLMDMGEAVDPDAVTDAHDSVRAQRDRLP